MEKLDKDQNSKKESLTKIQQQLQQIMVKAAAKQK